MNIASYSSTSEQRNPLIAGPRPTYTKKLLLAAGTLLAGAVLGRVLGDATVTAGAGNTVGSGTINSVTLGANVKQGRYTVMCIEPASNAGQFMLEDPNGNVVGKVTVAVAYSGQLGFTITDATDFVAGDHFFIDVALNDDEDLVQVKQVVAAATDGSQVPYAILAHEADASEDPVSVIAYTEGDFALNQITVGAGLTVAGVEEALRLRNIHLIPVAAA
jgi:hypothetical protein